MNRHDAHAARAESAGIPDLRWINRHVPIGDVARALDLPFQNGKIHCWRPKHADQSASVGIRKLNNTVKCFGCDTPPMGPVDLVRDVLGMQSPAEAGLWIAERFQVPRIPKGKHLPRPWPPAYMVGHEDLLKLLVRSGVWARLVPPAQRLVPVLLSFEEPRGSRRFRAHASQKALMRYSGIGSPNGLVRGLRALAEIGFLELPASDGPQPLIRETNTYFVTPRSDELWELAQTAAEQTRAEVKAERELRKLQRQKRLSLLREEREDEKGGPPRSCT